MNYKLMIAVLLACQVSLAQTTVDKKTFLETKDLKVLSTETTENSDKIAVLKIKFLDYSNMKIKFYEAGLDKTGFISINSYKYLIGAIPGISVITVPFKIREKNRQGYVTAKADVKNVGLYFPLIIMDKKRYWVDNSTSSHKFSIGFTFAPMTEELNDNNTNNYFNDSQKSYSSFMLSAGLSLTYTYKNITFAAIPLGYDFGLDNAGRNWDNHRMYWAGFGIGIDTKLFGF